MSRPSVSKLPQLSGRRSRSLPRPSNIGKPSIGGSVRDQRTLSQTPNVAASNAQYRYSYMSNNVEAPLSVRTYRSTSRTPRLTPSRSKSMENKVKKKDPRLITDKTWQVKAVSKIQQYLLQRGAGNFLNNGKNLRPLTLKMFAQIINYLIEPILTNHVTVKNYVERIPTILNQIKYPWQISASVLRTANTMHSWPTILAVMAWLVTIREKAIDSEEEEEEEEEEEISGTENQIENIKFKAEVAAYETFSKQEPTTEIENWIGAELARIFNLPSKVEEYVEKIISNVKKRIHEHEEIVQKSKSEIGTLEQQLTECKKMFAALREEEENKEQTRKQLHNCLQEDIANSYKLKDNYEVLTEKLDSLKVSGLVTPKMGLKIKDKLATLEAEGKLKLEMQEHRKKLSDELDMELSELNATLFEKISAYNLALVKPSLDHPEIEELFVPENGIMRSNMFEILTTTHSKKKEFMKKCLQYNKQLEQLETCAEEEQQAESSLESSKKETEMKKKMVLCNQQELEDLKLSTEKEFQHYLRNITKDKEKCFEITNSMTGLDEDKVVLDKLVERFTELQQKLPALAQKMVSFFEKGQVASYNYINQLNKSMVDLSNQLTSNLECLTQD